MKVEILKVVKYPYFWLEKVTDKKNLHEAINYLDNRLLENKPSNN